MLKDKPQAILVLLDLFVSYLFNNIDWFLITLSLNIVNKITSKAYGKYKTNK